jgi:TM2 domain-containing membrane protein YozV
LALLTGFLGLHNFYARHWLTGIIQLLISVASSLLGFGVIAPWIWAMVEAIVVHQDGDEMEMS